MREIDQALIPVAPTEPNEKHAPKGRRFQGIPGVEIAQSGRLWATWYAGGDGEGPENYVVLASSDDKGKTWKEVCVVDPPGNVRAFDPALWCAPDGKLWWFWTQCYSQQLWNINDGRSGVWRVIFDDAERPSMSEPKRIANGIMMNKPVILANGDWALPSAVWANQGGADALPELKDERFSNIVISRDQGRTFERRGGADVPFRAFDEHMIVELKDKRLWMLVRTAYGIGQSFSSDTGKSWTPGCDSLLGGPNSRFFIRRLKSGRLLLVNHIVDPTSPFARKNLVAKISEDEGRSWIGGLMLDEREGVSYPDGTQAQDGSLWVIYDYERQKGGFINLAHFTEEDIVAGNLTGKESKLKMEVSKYPYQAKKN